MKFKTVTNKVTSKVGRQILVVQKHSPTVMFAVGVTGVVATVVLACRATLKVEDVLDQGEKNEEHINESVGGELRDGGMYDEVDQRQDLAKNKIQVGFEIVKLYGPAFIVGSVSIACLTGSHVVLGRRYAGAAAAYAAVDQSYKEYRRRVVDEFGAGKDQEYRFGLREKEVAVDTDTGVVVETVTVLDTTAPKVNDPYKFLFSQDTSRDWKREPGYNQVFISSREKFSNDKLQGTGHIFLNEVLDMLGMERVPHGQLVGWVKGNGDNRVDFGLFRDGNAFMGQQFANGNEKSIWLEFNVDGVVFNLI